MFWKTSGKVDKKKVVTWFGSSEISLSNSITVDSPGSKSRANESVTIFSDPLICSTLNLKELYNSIHLASLPTCRRWFKNQDKANYQYSVETLYLISIAET